MPEYPLKQSVCTMKALRFVLVGLMILFAAVQFNDPDGLWWAFIYGVAALILLLANIRPDALRHPIGTVVLALVIAAMVVGVWFYWPEDPYFWRTEVFWETETAREGMGMMIALAFSLTVLPVVFSRSSSGTDKHSAPS